MQMICDDFSMEKEFTLAFSFLSFFRCADFLKIILSKLVDLQCCVNFCCVAK